MLEPNLSSAILYTYRRSLAARASAVADSGGFYEERPGITRFGLNVDFPLFNGSVGPRMSQSQAGDQLERDREFFAARGLPFCWWVDSNAEPAGLGRMLEREGLQTPGAFLSMAADLTERDQWPESTPEVRVRKVTGKGMFATFTGLFQEVFQMPDPICATYSSSLRSDQFHHYLAYNREGEPVGVRSFFFGGKMSLLLHAGVRQCYRGQGIAKAMTRRALVDARRLGSSHCASLLLTDQLARPVLERFGFAPQAEMIPYVLGAPADTLEPSPSKRAAALSTPSASSIAKA